MKISVNIELSKEASEFLHDKLNVLTEYYVSGISLYSIKDLSKSYIIELIVKGLLQVDYIGFRITGTYLLKAYKEQLTKVN